MLLNCQRTGDLTNLATFQIRWQMRREKWAVKLLNWLLPIVNMVGPPDLLGLLEAVGIRSLLFWRDYLRGFLSTNASIVPRIARTISGSAYPYHGIANCSLPERLP